MVFRRYFQDKCPVPVLQAAPAPVDTIGGEAAVTK